MAVPTPPSDAHIWAPPGGCRGWVVMAPPIRKLKEPSENVKQGRAAHNMAQHIFKNNVKDFNDCLGMVFENGVIADEEMVRGVALYVNHIENYFNTSDKGGIEEWVDWDGGKGVIDSWMYFKDTKTTTCIRLQVRSHRC